MMCTSFPRAMQNLSERHLMSHMITLLELFIKNFFNCETLLLSLVVVVPDPVTHLIVIINNEHRWLMTLNYSYIRTRMIKSSLKWLYTGWGWLLVVGAVTTVVTLRFSHFYCWYSCQKAELYVFWRDRQVTAPNTGRAETFQFGGWGLNLRCIVYT